MGFVLNIKFLHSTQHHMVSNLHQLSLLLSSVLGKNSQIIIFHCVHIFQRGQIPNVWDYNCCLSFCVHCACCQALLRVYIIFLQGRLVNFYRSVTFICNPLMFITCRQCHRLTCVHRICSVFPLLLVYIALYLEALILRWSVCIVTYCVTAALPAACHRKEFRAFL